MLGENVRWPSGLGSIPPPHASPQGQQQDFHAGMPEDLPALGGGNLPLIGIQPEKGSRFTLDLYFPPSLNRLGLRGLTGQSSVVQFAIPRV